VRSYANGREDLDRRRDRFRIERLDRRLQAHQLPCLIHGAGQPLVDVTALDRNYRAFVLLIGWQHRIRLVHRFISGL